MLRTLFFHLYILLFVIFIVKSSNTDNNLKSEKDDEIFIPEENWKEIKPGQAIPRGIHVRIDLKTGERQGKLINKLKDEEEENYSYNTNIQHIPTEEKEEENTEEEEMNNKLNSIDESRQRLQEAFKKYFGDNPPDEIVEDSTTDSDINENEKSPRFRTYEELKKILNEGNLEIKTDTEQLTTLIDSWQSNSHSEEVDKLNLLHSLEDLVHKYDTAVAFVQMDGFSRMLLPALGNSSTSAIRGAALRALAASAQSNPYVQKAALESGLLAQILQLLRTEPLPILKVALYALGCLIRGQLDSRKAAFGDYTDSGSGLAILNDLYKRAPSLQKSVRSLIADLTTEDALFGERLKRANWCQQLIEDTRSIQDADNVLEAIEALENVCHDYFKSNEAQQVLLYWHLLLIDAEDEETAQAVFKLIQRLRPRDEL